MDNIYTFQSAGATLTLASLSYSTGCQVDTTNPLLSELGKLYQINITVLIGVLEQFILSVSITTHCVILSHPSNNNVRG